MIKRKYEWETELHNYLCSVSRQEFKPGAFDCALFVAGAVKAMTGENLVPDIGAYKTIKAGIKKLKAAGYQDHIDIAAKYFEEIHPAFLQAGDIAVVDGETDNALGIVQGSAIYVLPPGGCVGVVPLTDAKRGFRIPYRVKE